jgi:hypothetical protein
VCLSLTTLPQITNSLAAKSAYAGDTGPVYIGSALAFIAAIVVYFGVPNFKEDFMQQEDARFRQYLEEAGYDTSLMGVAPLLSHDEKDDVGTSTSLANGRETTAVSRHGEKTAFEDA